MPNFIAIDIQLYKIFKLMRVSFFGTHCMSYVSANAAAPCVSCMVNNHKCYILAVKFISMASQLHAKARWWPGFPLPYTQIFHDFSELSTTPKLLFQAICCYMTTCKFKYKQQSEHNTGTCLVKKGYLPTTYYNVSMNVDHQVKWLFTCPTDNALKETVKTVFQF